MNANITIKDIARQGFELGFYSSTGGDAKRLVWLLFWSQRANFVPMKDNG